MQYYYFYLCRLAAEKCVPQHNKKRALSSRRVLFLLSLRTYKTEFIHHRSHLVCKFAIQCPELGKFLRHVLFPQHLQLIVTAVPVVYQTVVELIRTCHGTWMSLFQAINRAMRALSFSTTTLAQHHTSPTRRRTWPSMMHISLMDLMNSTIHIIRLIHG